MRGIARSSVGRALCLVLAICGAGAISRAAELGARAALVGFMGDAQQYALVYVTPFNPNDPIVLSTLPLTAEHPQLQWPVALHSSALQEQSSAGTLHEYYLFRLAKYQRESVGPQFAAPLAQLDPLTAAQTAGSGADTAGPAPAVPPPTSAQIAFRLGVGEVLVVRPKTLRTLLGARTHDGKRHMTCVDRDARGVYRLSCDNCYLRDERTGLGDRQVPACRTTSGRTTRNLQGDGTRIWQRGAPCLCGAEAYEMTITMERAGQQFDGLSTVAVGTDADPQTFLRAGGHWEAPTFRLAEQVPTGIAAYRSSAGVTVVVGSLVHVGPATIAHFPVVGVVPPLAAPVPAAPQEQTQAAPPVPSAASTPTNAPEQHH